MKMKPVAYLAALTIGLGAGFSIPSPVQAESCAVCRANYLNCMKYAGSNQQLKNSCTLNYEICMDRC